MLLINRNWKTIGLLSLSTSPNFYIYSQGSIDSYLARIPDNIGDELLESEEVGDPPVKQRTVNNPKEEANEPAVLMHLKSGDNSKAQSMEDHLFENLELAWRKWVHA